MSDKENSIQPEANDVKLPIANTTPIKENEINNVSNLNAILPPISTPLIHPSQWETSLKPVILDPQSPYFSPVGTPQTSGDYSQRIKNKLKESKKPFFYKFNARRSPIFLGATMVTSSFIAIYFSNVLVTYEKEKMVETLLAERNRLRDELKK
ncbi:hypothetical protein BC833DRAFT_584842 [Globomyces pollinis-pini]|nr:hypothetical protein BC833DRAFT_584842 [Globomyces pollinis-pini]